jgi:hypothetical protein
VKRAALHFIICLLSFTNATAQSNLQKNIADIKYKYLELAQYPDYLKKRTFLTELDSEDRKKYIIGEVIGYYNAKKLCIVKEFRKTEGRKHTREFYLYEGKLIFVYEQLEEPDTANKKRLRSVYSCGYYFKDDKLIHKKPKGGPNPHAGMSNGKIREFMFKLLAEHIARLKTETSTEK